MDREDASVFSTASLRERSLAEDRITPIGDERSHLVDGGYATLYRRGTFVDTAEPCPEPSVSLGLGISLAALGGVARRRARRSR